MDWQNDLLKARDKNGKKYSETYIMIKADERVRGNVKENGLFGGFCGRDSGIGPAQRAKTTIWN